MTKSRKNLSRIEEALLETVQDLRGGSISEATANKITLRIMREHGLPELELVPGDEIRVLRERERMSQAVFALYLNVTVGYLSQLERGVKHASGPALALLNVIRRKGIEAIF